MYINIYIDKYENDDNQKADEDRLHINVSDMIRILKVY